jgi:hypothetical protein
MIGRTARQVIYDTTECFGDINSQQMFVSLIQTICRCCAPGQAYPLIYDAIADIICDKYIGLTESSDYRIKISLAIGGAVRLYRTDWIADNCELLITHLIKSSQELLERMKALDAFAMEEFGNNIICFKHKR